MPLVPSSCLPYHSGVWLAARPLITGRIANRWPGDAIVVAIDVTAALLARFLSRNVEMSGERCCVPSVSDLPSEWRPDERFDRVNLSRVNCLRLSSFLQFRATLLLLSQHPVRFAQGLLQTLDSRSVPGPMLTRSDVPGIPQCGTVTGGARNTHFLGCHCDTVQ